MALETMTKLASTTVGSGGSSSVVFSDIPQHYSDLVIKISCRTSRAADEDGLGVKLNSTATGYTYRVLAADGSTATSVNTAYGELWTCRIQGANPGTNVFSTTDLYIPNYSGTFAKLITADSLTEKNGTNGYMTWSSVSQPNPSPVTSVTLSGLNSPFQQHSVFTLYGVKNLRKTMPIPGWSTGGSLKFDGTYFYHVFTSTDVFIPSKPLTADILVVAGGGGGGSDQGGGGGAGGMLEVTGQSLLTVPYTVIVGAGGTGSTGSGATSGANSRFGMTTIALGGGRGGNYGLASLTGGSGGGAASGIFNTGSSGTSGQGNAGGNGGFYGAGGGGKSAAGTSTPASNNAVPGAGNGGAGGTSTISGGATTGVGQLSSGSYYFAGGGGGGSTASNAGGAPGDGGLGGGGRGQAQNYNLPAVAGTANTGGGGGGGNQGGQGYATLGAAGGSGVVIIRYKA